MNSPDSSTYRKQYQHQLNLSDECKEPLMPGRTGLDCWTAALQEWPWRQAYCLDKRNTHCPLLSCCRAPLCTSCHLLASTAVTAANCLTPTYHPVTESFSTVTCTSTVQNGANAHHLEAHCGVLLPGLPPPVFRAASCCCYDSLILYCQWFSTW